MSFSAIANALEEDFGNCSDTAQLLAHHYKEAGNAEKAVGYLSIAASARCAFLIDRGAYENHASLQLISNCRRMTAPALEIKLRLHLLERCWNKMAMQTSS